MAEPIREPRDGEGNILTPADFDRWETPPGAIYSIPRQEEEPKAQSYEDVRRERR